MRSQRSGSRSRARPSRAVLRGCSRRSVCARANVGMPGHGNSHDTGFRRTARLAKVAGWAWGRWPRKPPLDAHANRRGLHACRLSFATSTPPHDARIPAPLHTETSTEEDGSGWAAQRAGATPDVGWREEPAERVPLASTPVPSHPPGMQSSQRLRSRQCRRSCRVLARPGCCSIEEAEVAEAF